jgi:hypothetical protein
MRDLGTALCGQYIYITEFRMSMKSSIGVDPEHQEISLQIVRIHMEHRWPPPCYDSQRLGITDEKHLQDAHTSLVCR